MSTDSHDSLEDWISQADAARIRGITRQAIRKLVQTGRLKTFKVGGHTFVSRQEVMQFIPKPRGRHKGQKSE
ncbi:MAG: helix-turn-helix domain-containing protein [Deltaproteobacteria bacterium]|nr:MAG: helix-turn-helix domain-containing protein [Deltaproteobacteria bacterium]TMI55091.1 MAG: helix-turn-helix domain-containing protein [Candidatus Bathyarchaeota archaeon]